MIYLTTGGNGAGKTLFTLADVRAQQLKENRPVYYHGFEALQPIKDFGWLPFEPEKWQDLPDGSICVFDECHNEFPAKISGELPDYVNAVAQFRRKRGFDFWLITPHPSMLHLSIRRLISAPSWHRHMKRPFNGTMVSQLKFDSPSMTCEKPNAGANAVVTMRAYPKEVYDWYKSSSLHTVKRTIPAKVWLLLACLVLIPVLFYMGFQSLGSKPAKVPEAQAGTQDYTSGPSAPKLGYVESLQPRIPGFPQSAPRYDDVTKPVTAPYPAACVEMGKRCDCFTQQGTALPTEPDLCKQIVKRGFFLDWQTAPQGSNQAPQASTQAPAPVGGATGVLGATGDPATLAHGAAVRDGQSIGAMRLQRHAVASY